MAWKIFLKIFLDQDQDGDDFQNLIILTEKWIFDKISRRSDQELLRDAFASRQTDKRRVNITSLTDVIRSISSCYCGALLISRPITFLHVSQLAARRCLWLFLLILNACGDCRLFSNTPCIHLHARMYMISIYHTRTEVHFKRKNGHFAFWVPFGRLRGNVVSK